MAQNSGPTQKPTSLFLSPPDMCTLEISRTTSCPLIWPNLSVLPWTNSLFCACAWSSTVFQFAVVVRNKIKEFYINVWILCDLWVTVKPLKSDFLQKFVNFLQFTHFLHKRLTFFLQFLSSGKAFAVSFLSSQLNSR